VRALGPLPPGHQSGLNRNGGMCASDWLPLSLSVIQRSSTIRHFDRQPPPDHGPRLNEQIRISPIRFIGANGEQLGLVPTVQALEKAREAGLDLVEVAAEPGRPGGHPPGLPQIRTCATNAYGSSSHGFAACRYTE
jgi:hypothetical protein